MILLQASRSGYKQHSYLDKKIHGCGPPWLFPLSSTQWSSAGFSLLYFQVHPGLLGHVLERCEPLMVLQQKLNRVRQPGQST